MKLSVVSVVSAVLSCIRILHTSASHRARSCDVGASLHQKRIDSGNDNIASAQYILDLTDASIERHAGADDGDAPLLPFVLVSYAQTLDGSISPVQRMRLDISSNSSFRLLHSLRARSDGVLIGINTLMVDSPRLTVRDPIGVVRNEEPRPVVLDSSLRIADATSIQLKRPVVFTTLTEDDERWATAEQRIFAAGGELVTCRAGGDGRCDLKDCLTLLRSRFDMRVVLIEGGAAIIQNTLERQIAQLFVVTLRPAFLGGLRSMTGQVQRPVHLEGVTAASIGGDVVILGQPTTAAEETEEHRAITSRNRPRVQFVTDDSLPSYCDVPSSINDFKSSQ